jgi:hypothetical protein
MKIYLTFIFALSLAACTSEESKVKTAIIEGVKEHYQTQITEDIAKGVTGKENLQKTAVKTLVDRAEIDVQQMEIREQEAVAAGTLKAVSAKERQALIDIMAKLNPKKEATFNVSNALGLIRQEMKGEDETVGFKMTLQKQDGIWKAKPAK